MRLKGLCLALLFVLLAGCDRGPGAPTETASSKASNPDFGERWQYPRERVTKDGKRVIVYAPQIRTWDNFEHFTAQVAVEFPENSEETRYGVIDLSGDTIVDRKARLVRVPHPKVDRVTFTGAEGAKEHEERIRATVESEPLEIPLDVFLYYLADGVLESPPPVGFNDKPPPIHVVESPAFLLIFDGEPLGTPVGDTGLEMIMNANFPTFRDKTSGTYYLLTGHYRYAAAKAAGPWGTITDLPAAFRKIPARGEYASIAAVVATSPKNGPAPLVISTFKPAEIIVLDGKPQGREIAGTGGLESITNTESPLFRLGDTYYLLTAGRWFSTQNLVQGPWKFTMPLPDAFAKIPEDDASSDVRASVPGTLEARRATLEATLPEKKKVKAGAAPDVKVTYAGEPKFEPVADTEVKRAVNTGNDIIQYGDKFYLCYEGMWYVADKPTGPWAATASVPAAIYQIPPSSPSYPVTQVIVQTTDAGEVQSSYNGAYAAGMFIGFGVAYYGTGYYYPPYYYGGYYYPYGGSYGHGSWYNPNTGGYGSRSVAYGPYGGYSYNQGYNPKTGRSSYVETAWDGDEWASSGGSYNPRTGISTDTDRYYSEDSNKMKMERTVEGPGGNEMKVDRKTDFDTGTSTTTRKTDAGGKSEITRQRNADGSISSSGSIDTAGGKSATIESDRRGGEGTTTIKGEGGGTSTVERDRNQDGSVSREGSFSKDGQTVNTETRRDGTSSVTRAEGSGGGQAISASGGIGDRTTIAQSGSGDIYAGHDGNVYRKTDDGWQQHNDSGWNDVDVPDRPDRPDSASAGGDSPRYGGSGSLESRDTAGTRDLGGQGGQNMGGAGGVSAGQLGGATRAQPSTRDYGQLNRDAAARSGGFQSHQTRTSSSGMSRGARPSRRR